jgi:hypothetical protein
LGVDSITLTTLYPGPCVAGDVIEIQGLMNDYLNTRYEVIEVRSTVLTVRRASLWNLLRDQLRSAWLRLRWQIDDAYLELCDIWDEAKTDWRQTLP